PNYRGWMRLAPGYMDATFLMFNLRSFGEKWRLNGIRAKQPHPPDFECHYGICEKLTRHKYLRPHHTRRYGVGNVLKDGETAVLWHQWFGAYRVRLQGPDAAGLPGAADLAEVVRTGEEAFLKEYPALDLSELRPAWGPEFDAAAERQRVVAALPGSASLAERVRTRLLRWSGYGIRKFFLHGWRWFERRWRLR
ncbi:MAG: hypothetical protein ACT4P8_02225, partial [Betaproteobacteria bacterium]